MCAICSVLRLLILDFFICHTASGVFLYNALPQSLCHLSPALQQYHPWLVPGDFRFHVHDIAYSTGNKLVHMVFFCFRMFLPNYTFHRLPDGICGLSVQIGKASLFVAFQSIVINHWGVDDSGYIAAN